MQQKAIDQRGLKTLALWTIWAVASVSVFAMLYQKADAWNFIVHDATHVTWIILGLFSIGVMVSFIHSATLTAEWFRAYRIEATIQAKGLMGLAERRSRRLVDRFIQSLRIIVEQNGRLDVEGLVDVEFAAQHRTSQFVSLIGNLLITLGLIGTLLGMTLTLTGLNGALDALGKNDALLLEGLKNALSGMGVAFYTTLLGSILGGVLLRVFAWITDSSVDGLQDMMLRACLVYASGDMKPSSEREMKLLDAELTQLQQRMELIRQGFSASRSEMREFTDQVRSLHETLQTLSREDPLWEIAAQQARYSKVAHESKGFFARWFGTRSEK